MQRYRKEENDFCIDLALTSVTQLFDKRDPSPFREKDLDEDFVRFLILSTSEIGLEKSIKLCIKINPGHEVSIGLTPEDIKSAIQNYFSFEIENEQNNLRQLLNQGRWQLVYGLVFLSLFSIVISQIPENAKGLLKVIKEGGYVLSWVAMWKPLNTFLYEWWPYRSKIKLLEKVRDIKLSLIS